METLRPLLKLFAYDEWANRETADALAAAGSPPPRAVKLLAHVVGSERLWHSRLRREKRAPAVWPDLALTQCRAVIVEVAGMWREYLAALAPATLEEPVSYVNSKGEPWTSRVEDILTHVVLHSSYHRGQIASDMRAAGLTPAYTDYIHAVRQGLMK